MPHENSWNSESLYRKFSGEISGEEILESNFELQAHPNFSVIKYIINDFTNVTEHTVKAMHANVYAKTDNIIANTKGKLKIALVVPPTSPVIEVANNYREQMRGSLFSCEIFSTFKDAENWGSKK